MVRHAVALLLLCVGLSACTSSKGIISERTIPASNEAYELDSGDKLLVTVFGQTDLSGNFAVDGSGNVSLPLISPVMARGLTVPELQEAIATELGKTLLRNPNVSVQVVEFRPFFILGEVTRAGSYPYVNGMTVQSAVAIAGGFTYRADEDTVHITRKRGGKLIEMNLDTTSLVQPGDTILVGERFF